MLMVACTSDPAEGSLYHLYADRKGLSVAEVDGFVLNDTVRIDVVMLQAESPEEWQQLKAEFDIRGQQLVADTVPVHAFRMAGPPDPGIIDIGTDAPAAVQRYLDAQVRQWNGQKVCPQGKQHLTARVVGHVDHTCNVDRIRMAVLRI